MTGYDCTRRAALAGLAVLPLAPGLARAQTVGSITRFDAGLDAVVDVGTPIEVLGTGYKWSEGPVWVKDGGYLLFSDVPANICYRWKQGEGVTRFLEPSGLAGPVPAGIREAGANGLAIDAQGRLIMADSGSRGVFALDLATKKKTVLADRFEGKRFNSCNDVAIRRDGTIYFTDPPYGLADGDASPLKELAFNGVFRRTPDGAVHLIDKGLKRPNGVALSPDQSILYVAMSDEARPEILAYALDGQGATTGAPRVFHDFRAALARKLPGRSRRAQGRQGGPRLRDRPGRGLCPLARRKGAGPDRDRQGDCELRVRRGRADAVPDLARHARARRVEDPGLVAPVIAP